MASSKSGDADDHPLQEGRREITLADGCSTSPPRQRRVKCGSWTIRESEELVTITEACRIRSASTLRTDLPSLAEMLPVQTRVRPRHRSSSSAAHPTALNSPSLTVHSLDSARLWLLVSRRFA